MTRILSRGLILPAALLALWPQAANAQAKTYKYRGTVANACSLSNPNPTISVARSGGITVTFSPSSVTLSCNAPVGGTLSVSSTRLQRVGSPGTFQNYTLQVSGWGAPVSYTTAAVSPAPQTRSNGAQSGTLTFACTGGCTTASINNNTSWTATITLGLSPNP